MKKYVGKVVLTDSFKCGDHICAKNNLDKGYGGWFRANIDDIGYSGRARLYYKIEFDPFVKNSRKLRFKKYKNK